jgi:prepilin-type N-terminal cleavage/methylation domain-containing protein
VGDVNCFFKGRDHRGFTLVEIIATLIIIGIIAAVIVSSVSGVADTDRVSQENVIKNHIRYAQSMAMKQGTAWGIKCDGTDYWLFRTNDPDTPANQMVLPNEENVKVTLANKKVSMTVFTLFFDATGRPYTAYTDASTNTPVSAANPLAVTVGSIPAGGATPAFNVTPETGFIP